VLKTRSTSLECCMRCSVPSLTCVWIMKRCSLTQPSCLVSYAFASLEFGPWGAFVAGQLPERPHSGSGEQRRFCAGLEFSPLPPSGGSIHHGPSIAENFVRQAISYVWACRVMSGCTRKLLTRQSCRQRLRHTWTTTTPHTSRPCTWVRPFDLVGPCQSAFDSFCHGAFMFFSFAFLFERALKALSG
jgi:hypothetical protein